jgi:hypothetical protein
MRELQFDEVRVNALLIQQSARHAAESVRNHLVA